LPADIHHFELGERALLLVPGTKYATLTVKRPEPELTPTQTFVRQLAAYRPLANRALRKFGAEDRDDIILRALAWSWENRAKYDPSRASAGTWFIRYAIPEGRRQLLSERRKHIKEIASDPQLAEQTLKSDSNTLRQLIVQQGTEQIFASLEHEFPSESEEGQVLEALMSDDYARADIELVARRYAYDRVKKRLRELFDELMPSDDPINDPHARSWSGDMPGSDADDYHRPDRMAEVMGDWSWRSPFDHVFRSRKKWRPHTRELLSLFKRATELREAWIVERRAGVSARDLGREEQPQRWRDAVLLDTRPYEPRDPADARLHWRARQFFEDALERSNKLSEQHTQRQLVAATAMRERESELESSSDIDA
jgi:hypothetical protein